MYVYRTCAACRLQTLIIIFDRPVYEYPLNGQWIMLDMDDGYVLWTGIWKGGHPSHAARLAPTALTPRFLHSSR